MSTLVVAQNKHAIMGPNGSGKSTLAYALMGHPAYQITEGQILFDGEDVTELGATNVPSAVLPAPSSTPHGRSPGATVTSFLRSDQRAAQGGERRRGQPRADPGVPARSC